MKANPIAEAQAEADKLQASLRMLQKELAEHRIDYINFLKRLLEITDKALKIYNEYRAKEG